MMGEGNKASGYVLWGDIPDIRVFTHCLWDHGEVEVLKGQEGPPETRIKEGVNWTVNCELMLEVQQQRLDLIQGRKGISLDHLQLRGE